MLFRGRTGPRKVFQLVLSLLLLLLPLPLCVSSLPTANSAQYLYNDESAFGTTSTAARSSYSQPQRVVVGESFWQDVSLLAASIHGSLDLFLKPNGDPNINTNTNTNTDNDERDGFFLRGPPTARKRFLQSTSESTHVNIFQKLGESLGMTIIGFILICCMPVLIWKNEGRHVTQLAKIDYFKNHATLVQDCSAPGDDQVGHLVHFVGSVTVGDDLLEFQTQDPALNSLNIVEPISRALVLKRTCYIYQKFEVAQQQTKRDMVGGGETRTTTYHLQENWTPLGPQPATLPHLPGETNSRGIWDQLVAAAGTTNNTNGAGPAVQQPPNLPPELMLKMGLVDTSKAPHASVVAPTARVGAFAIPPSLIMENPQVFCTHVEPVPNASLPVNVPGCEGLVKGSDNILRTFNEHAVPQNGDVKVVYEYVRDYDMECTFIVQQTAGTGGEQPFGMDKIHVVDGKCMGIVKNDLGDVMMIRRGRHDLQAMIGMAKDDEKKILYVLRVLGCGLLLAGWIMLFAPFVTVLQILPLLSQLGSFAVILSGAIVSCLCCITITTVAYIRYRPLLAFGILAVSLGIWAIVAWQLNYAVDNGGSEENGGT